MEEEGTDALAGGTSEGAAAGAKDTADRVPEYRFSEVIAQRNEARVERDGLLAEKAAWLPQSARVSELEAQLATRDTEITGLRSTFERERSMLSAGLTDPEGQGIASYLYSQVQVAEGQEKPAFAEWLQFSGEGVTPPKALAPYLSSAGASSTTATKADVNAGAKDTKPTAGTLTNERVKAVREEAVKSGDWSAYRELRKAFTPT